MSETDPRSGGDEILGRLPRHRPGRRSPQRDSAAAKAGRETPAPRERARASESSSPEAPEAPEAPAGEGDALAELARTGVSVASGALSLGMRAAGGALKAIRGTVERR